MIETEVLKSLICDLPAPVNRSKNRSEKSCLPFKVETDGEESASLLEVIIEVFKTLVCDPLTAVIKLTNLSSKKSRTH